MILPLAIWAHGNQHVAIEKSQGLGSIFNSFADFPTLHPLVVHFPIVLILGALVLQVLNVYFKKRECSLVIIGILGCATISSLIASFAIHPHTENLARNVMEVLEYHEIAAYLATWLSVASLALKIFHVKFKANVASLKYVVASLLFIATAAVSIAGHLGSQLVHLEGVGVKGEYLIKQSANGQGHDH